VNVVNALHAWPNRASYEFRLVKYASRGFGICVPGLDRLHVDSDKIRRTPLEELKGMGRLLHIAHQTEFSLLGMEEFKKRHEKRQGDKVFSWPTGNGECYWQPSPTIFGDSAFKLSFYDDEHEGGLGDSSFGHSSDGLITKNAKVQIRIFDRYEGKTRVGFHGEEGGGFQGGFQLKEESLRGHMVGLTDRRHSFEKGWDLVMDASGQKGLKIPAQLKDCWDTSRRTREYLNDQDAITCDIHARYASGAASSNEHSAKCEHPPWSKATTVKATLGGNKLPLGTKVSSDEEEGSEAEEMDDDDLE
jgi:hypothetical protein